MTLSVLFLRESLLLIAFQQGFLNDEIAGRNQHSVQPNYFPKPKKHSEVKWFGGHVLGTNGNKEPVPNAGLVLLKK